MESSSVRPWIIGASGASAQSCRSGGSAATATGTSSGGVGADGMMASGGGCAGGAAQRGKPVRVEGGNDRWIKLWDVTQSVLDGEPLATIQAHTGVIWQIALSAGTNGWASAR
jgi:hypothetical protein